MQIGNNPMIKTLSLTPSEYDIIVNKATERPNTGKFTDYGSNQLGTYLCRQCGIALFRSDDKFTSSCGWPSFDKEITGAVKMFPDSDGRRTEIVCNNCGGHLGHVFDDGPQPNGKRFCINSGALTFVPESNE